MPDHDNRTGWIVGFGCTIALIAFLIWLLTGCSWFGGSQRTEAAQAAVREKLDAITEDGLVTPDEARDYFALVKEAWKVEKEEAQTGMDKVLTGLATGSVPAAIAAIILNMIRNNKSKREWGTPDAPKDAISLELQTKGVIAPKA